MNTICTPRTGLFRFVPVPVERLNLGQCAKQINDTSTLCGQSEAQKTLKTLVKPRDHFQDYKDEITSTKSKSKCATFVPASIKHHRVCKE